MPTSRDDCQHRCVELVLDAAHVIGAMGGGSDTTTEAAASARNAFVKMRPIGYRKDIAGILDPFPER